MFALGPQCLPCIDSVILHFFQTWHSALRLCCELMWFLLAFHLNLQGCDGAKIELQEVVDFLKNPDKYTALGAKIPKVGAAVSHVYLVIS
eukprot:1149343-Pelagomonas_calceolata.AAC.7